MSSHLIPEPAAEPDNTGGDFWSPADADLPATAAGILRDRVTLKFSKPRTTRGGKERTHFDVLEIETAEGDLLPVPMGRAAAARLVEKEDPRVGDGVAVTIFPPGESGYPYALRVNRNSDERSEITKQAEELFGDGEAS